MSLTTRSKPSSKQMQHHRKRSGDHQRRSKDFHKAYWPYLPMLGLAAVVIVFGAIVLGPSGAVAGSVVAGIAVVAIIL
jgi:hypothetical protein